MDYLQNMLGTVYSGSEYAAFITFTLLGMLFIKMARYRKKKAQRTKYITFSWRHWIDDNFLDVSLALMSSFFTLRFLGDLIKQIPVPQFMDVMLYGLALGLFYQYVFHKLLNKATVENTLKINIKKP